jgi:hypothetical protein
MIECRQENNYGYSAQCLIKKFNRLLVRVGGYFFIFLIMSRMISKIIILINKSKSIPTPQFYQKVSE